MSEERLGYVDFKKEFKEKLRSALNPEYEICDNGYQILVMVSDDPLHKPGYIEIILNEFYDDSYVSKKMSIDEMVEFIKKLADKLKEELDNALTMIGKILFSPMSPQQIYGKKTGKWYTNAEWEDKGMYENSDFVSRNAFIAICIGFGILAVFIGLTLI